MLVSENWEQTFCLLEYTVDGARAAGTGHGDVEFVVVGRG